MNILCFFVPEDSLEIVKESLFALGAGAYQNYDQCSWQVQGEGQFRPLTGANPAIGRIGRVEKVKEWKVEILVQDNILSRVIKCLLKTHPYEEVAYYVIPFSK